MKTIEIDLAEPFEKIVATVLALPPGCAGTATDRVANSAELKQVIRGLYEAANGRQVETNVGLVAIAPPALGFLKAKPFRVSTQIDLLIEAAARVIGGFVTADGPDDIAQDLVDGKNGCEAALHYRPAHRAGISLVLNAG